MKRVVSREGAKKKVPLIDGRKRPASEIGQSAGGRVSRLQPSPDQES